MGTEIFKIDASWAEKLTKTRVQFLLTPTVIEISHQITRVNLSYDVSLCCGGHCGLSLSLTLLLTILTHYSQFRTVLEYSVFVEIHQTVAQIPVQAESEKVENSQNSQWC